MKTPKGKMLRSAAILAQDMDNTAILVFSKSGYLGYLLGALRPKDVPIFAFTDDKAIFRQLLLPWGVEPFLMPFSTDPEETIRDAMETLKKSNWSKPGDRLVVITNVLAHGKIVDSLQLRQIE